MRRTTSILPTGWAKQYRAPAKVNEPTGDLGDVWAAIDANPEPNRAERRRLMRIVARSVRISLFHMGGLHRRKTFKSRRPDV